jgi:outer membrane protein OmpA-like peptidoglycan-associated protein
LIEKVPNVRKKARSAVVIGAKADRNKALRRPNPSEGVFKMTTILSKAAVAIAFGITVTASAQAQLLGGAVSGGLGLGGLLMGTVSGTGVEVEKRGQQIVLEMPSDVTFAFDKFNIQPRFFGVLNTVARTLSRYPATYVDVNGHTDAIGSYAYNQVLSERRAGSVADYLADHSVDPARMHVQGFGKTEPIASNATVYGRAANRRVEIVLTPYAG